MGLVPLEIFAIFEDWVHPDDVERLAAEKARIKVAEVGDMMSTLTAKIEALSDQPRAIECMPDGFVDTDTAAQILNIDRSTLERRLAEAPHGLPGAPINVGTFVRKVWRWDPKTLVAWFQEMNEARRPCAKPTRVRRKQRKPANGFASTEVVDWNAV